MEDNEQQYHQLVLNEQVPNAPVKKYMTQEFLCLVFSALVLRVFQFQNLGEIKKEYNYSQLAGLIAALIVGSFVSQIGQKKVLMWSFVNYGIFFILTAGVLINYEHLQTQNSWLYTIFPAFIFADKFFGQLIMITIITTICKMWPGQYTKVISYIVIIVIAVIIAEVILITSNDVFLTSLIVRIDIFCYLMNFFLIQRCIPDMGTIIKGKEILKDILYGLFHYKALLFTLGLIGFIQVSAINLFVYKYLIAITGQYQFYFYIIMIVVASLLSIRRLNIEPIIILSVSFILIIVANVLAIASKYSSDSLWILIIQSLQIPALTGLSLFYIPHYQRLLKSINILNLDLACSFYIITSFSFTLFNIWFSTIDEHTIVNARGETEDDVEFYKRVLQINIKLFANVSMTTTFVSVLLILLHMMTTDAFKHFKRTSQVHLEDPSIELH